MPSVEAAKPLIAADAEQDIKVTIGESVEAVFSNRGATLKSWKLKHYKDGTGQSLELIPSNIQGAVQPFTLEFDDAATTAKLRDALFKPEQSSLTVGTSPATLAFEYRDADGLIARKEYSFAASQPYMIRFSADVRAGDRMLTPTLKWGPALATGAISSGLIYAPAPQPIFYRDKSVTRVAIGSIESHRQEQGSFGFAGVDDHYFLAAILPGPEPLQLRYDPIQIAAQGSTPALRRSRVSAGRPR